MLTLKENVTKLLEFVVRFGIAILGLLTLFIFWNLTTEFYETPKFLALSLFVILLLILSTLKFATEGKVTLRVTPLDLPLLAFLIISVVSTVFSQARYISILGNAPSINGGLASLVFYIFLYFILVNNLKNIKHAKPIISFLLLGGLVLSVITIFYYIGLYIIPIQWIKALNFTPTGSNFSTTAVLSLLLPYLIIYISKESHLGKKLILTFILTMFAITITLTGSLSTYIASIMALILSLLLSIKNIKSNISNHLVSLLVPLAAVAILAFLSFVHPLGKASNPFYTLAQNYPREITLPLVTSWKVSVSSFRDSPFIGTGPATYLFDFTTYKPLEFNNLKFWNIRFSSGFNEYFTILATLGGAGLVVFLILTATFIVSAFKAFASSGEQDDIHHSLAISGIVFFVILAFHPASLVIWVIGMIILASFMATSQNLTKEVRIRLAATKTSETGYTGFALDLFPVILICIILILTMGSLYLVGRLAIADYFHKQALSAINQNKPLEAYNQLVVAEKLNPVNDLYHTDLAQVNFALANLIVASKKTSSESSPSASFTNEDKKNIQQLLQQAINEGKNSVAISPKSASNWEILGSVYKQISGVSDNALQFSLDAYGKAIKNDPLNPALRLNVGSLYYSVKNYDLAIRFFNDAVNLKPDYVNGYYNLSLALRDKGDLKTAQVVAEKAASLLDPNSSEYQTVIVLINDLKQKNSSK